MNNTQTIAIKTLSKNQQPTRSVRAKHKTRATTVGHSEKTKVLSKKKTISAASVATTAVIAGTTSAVSGVGTVILQHIIGFTVYLAYSPTNAFSQYATAQIAASMSGAIVSSTLISTIVNIAFGVIVTLSVIFVSVIIYNLFIADTSDDELSFFQVIGHTISTVFRKIFG